jgi:hypothetical protein
LAFLEHAARNRRQWLRNYAGIMRRVVGRVDPATGKEAPPYAFLVRADAQQDDPGTTYELLETLAAGAVEVEEAQSEFTADGVRYPAGTRVIRLGQPAGKFAKTLLEVQQYPDLRRWPDGPPAAPYDIAGHTLPLQMGVGSVQVEKPFEAALTSAEIARRPGRVVGSGSYGWAIAPRLNYALRAMHHLLSAGFNVYRAFQPIRELGLPEGTIVVPPQEGAAEQLEQLAAENGVDVIGIDDVGGVAAFRQQLPRVGLYQSWRPSIDEGWTRWIFEEYGLPYETLHNVDIRQGGLRERFDTIVLPEQKPEDILNGNPDKNKYKEPYPPEYVGGLGRLGADALRAFVEQGGTLVALDCACDFAIKQLYLPVRNAVEGLNEEAFYCPGSLLRILVDTTSELGWGLRRNEVALFMKSPVFAVPEEQRGPRVAIAASYPLYEPNLSGWILGVEHLAGKAALVEVRLERGRVVLIGFRPQFRAQARGTYKVLFNAVLRGGQHEEEWLTLGV